MDMVPAAFSIPDAAKYIGLGRTKLYELINNGQLPAIHFGKRTLVRRADLEALLIANSQDLTHAVEER